MLFELGILRQFLDPTKFSRFGYIVAILYLLAGIGLVAGTAYLKSREQDNFQCDLHPDIRFNEAYLKVLCYSEYDIQYNAPLPLYGFTCLKVSLVMVVCFIYSWCVTRTNKVAPASSSDEESTRSRQPRGPRRVFCFYFLHLMTRFGLMTLFTVLETTAFFPSGFPANFSCLSATAQPWNITSSNATITKLKPTSQAFNCHSSVARYKTNVSFVILVLNIIFLVLVLTEIIYLVVRAFQNSNFTTNSEFCVKYLSNENGEFSTSLDFSNRIKTNILQQTKKLQPLTANEDKKEFDDIFVDPEIQQAKTTADNRRPNVPVTRHQLNQRASITLNDYEELFLPSEKAKKSSPKVLIVGRSGIGKSFLCKKLLRDWSKKNTSDNERFHFAFLLKFRWFNLETFSVLSLWDLLKKAACSGGDVENHVIKYLLENPERILLIFDGLDEFNDLESWAGNEEGYPDNRTERMPVFVLYMKLLLGKLLCGATILTTCNTSATQIVELSWFDKTIEIIGFNKEQVLKYVDNYCKQDEDSAVAQRIKEHINTNLHLLEVCYTPVICHMVCYLVREDFSAGHSESVDSDTRMTKVYQNVMEMFIAKHHPDYKVRTFQAKRRPFPKLVDQSLDELGSLAKTGIAERKTIFDSSKVVAGMRKSGLLRPLSDTTEVRSFQRQERFRFIHSTFQDFFAAREIAKMEPDKFNEFIASNADDSKWHLVLQFVAGLLKESGKDKGALDGLVNSFVKCLHDSLLSDPTNREKALLMMKCLSEYNDDSTAKRAADELEEDPKFQKSIDLWKCRVKPIDCTAIVYLVQNFKSLDSIDLSDNSIGGGCQELASLIKNGGPTKLNLSNNKITDKDLASVLEAATTAESNLTELDIGLNNSIALSELLKLCDLLKQRKCKLDHLNLYGLRTTDCFCSKLGEALNHEYCRLTHLHLDSDEITDKGLQYLCDSLQLERCKLRYLYLHSNTITDEGLQHLCESLQHANCKLEDLHLGGEKITDVGFQYLCETLKNKNCKLKYLYLESDAVTDNGLQNLLEVFTSGHYSLTVLGVISNQITDDVEPFVRQLIRHKNFKLKDFFIKSTKMTERGLQRI